MARTKRKPMQLETPPPLRPLWSEGLTLGDINHISYLVDTGMDRLRVPLEHSAASSMNRTQSVAEHESISATAHATAAPDVLPQEQEEEEALAQDHVPEEDEALIFKFETAPSDIEYNQDTEHTPLRCRQCTSTFVHQYQLVAHVWGAHMRQDNLHWLPGPIHREQEAAMQHLISTLAQHEGPVGESPVSTSDTRLSSDRGPPIASRIPITRRPVSRAAGSSTTHNVPRVTTLAQPPLVPAASASVAPAGAFPVGALELDQPFKLGQPVPLGVKVPTDASLTSFKWEVYNRRIKTPFDWNSRKSVRLANHWRSRTTQGAFKRLGVQMDRRKKGTVTADAAAHNDEGEEDGENGDDEEGQDDEKMDTGE